MPPNTSPKSPQTRRRLHRAGRKPAPGESYEAARRRKERALADLREIEAETARGQRLRRTDVLRERVEAYRSIRAGILAVPSRVRARLPHLTAFDVDVLDQELRAALIVLAGSTHEHDDEHKSGQLL